MFRIDKMNNITITKGDDATFMVHLFDACGNPQESDGLFTMTVKKDEQLFQITTEDGQFIISHSLTASADAGIYMYDIEYITAAGNINTIAKGLFSIEGEITT